MFFAASEGIFEFLENLRKSKTGIEMKFVVKKSSFHILLIFLARVVPCMEQLIGDVLLIFFIVKVTILLKSRSGRNF